MNALLRSLLDPTHITRLSSVSPPCQSQNPKLTLQLPRKAPTHLRAGARGFGSADYKDTNDDKSGGGGAKPKPTKDDDDDEIPQVVFDRMLRRILVFVGSPMATGIGMLYLMSALKEQKIWDVPLWLPFVTTVVSFGTSALGIAYGTLSSSWEPEREGSLLGWEEAQRNWPELWTDDD